MVAAAVGTAIGNSITGAATSTVQRAASNATYAGAASQTAYNAGGTAYSAQTNQNVPLDLPAYCPHCGAPTINDPNCEYCGSYLVNQ